MSSGCSPCSICSFICSIRSVGTPSNCTTRAKVMAASPWWGGPLTILRLGYRPGVGIVHAGIAEVADRPVGSVITVRGKELPLGATVADARAIFEPSSVQLIPLLDGRAYAGAVSRDDTAEAADDEPIAG